MADEDPAPDSASAGKAQVYIHRSAKIPVPAFGRTLDLRLAKPDLVEDGRQYDGAIYIEAGGMQMCTVDQAEEWVAALTSLVRTARGDGGTGPASPQ